MKNIGSYIELDFEKNHELFKNITQEDLKRLNTCRAAIYHAAICYGVKKIWIAKYQCDVVKNFLERKGLIVYVYDIDLDFLPLIESNSKDSAIVFTNYFGIFGDSHFKKFIDKYNNVIIDNAQALFCEPIVNCFNCYSPRKFVGSPDGAYAIGKNANCFHYNKDLSSISSQFLLMRYEFGCEGDGYKNKKENDKRIDDSDILEMSDLTYVILDSIHYDEIKKKRLENFNYARSLFDEINELDIDKLIDKDIVYPMGYPLLISNLDIISEFHKNKIYQPRFWEYLRDDKYKGTLEKKFADNIALICIDQRYGKEEIDFQFEIVKELLHKR